MPNDLTGNPLIIDTPGATVLYGQIKVKSIRWVGATTAGHVVEIQEPDGDVLWRSLASGANHVEADLIERWWHDGFKVPTLGSGVLYIEYS